MRCCGRLVNAVLVHRKVSAILALNALLLTGNLFLFSHETDLDEQLVGQRRRLQEDLEVAKEGLQLQGQVDATGTSKGNAATNEVNGQNDKNQGPKSIRGNEKENVRASGKEKHEENKKDGAVDDRQEAVPPRGNPYGLTDAKDDFTVASLDKDYTKLREHYTVPDIETTNLINCEALFANDSAEMKKAEELYKHKPKVPIYEETYMEMTTDCERFKQQRGYVTVPLTEEEEKFPLAFSISMYTEVELTERLLRAIYQPQNIYCIHIDIKSPLLLHRTVRSLANCFDNVFIASHLDKVKWGDVSVLFPSLNCMRDLDRYYRGRWKYYINLTGQEFPLRTNWELVQIAKIFNGSNDIAGSIPRLELARIQHIWTHRWSKTYQQTIFYDTLQHKEPPPFNLKIFKGELHGLFTPKMVSYVVNQQVSKTYLQWCFNSGHPSEHYFNTLNYNTHLKAPGGYTGPLDVAHRYSYNPIIRAKHWQDENYGNRQCQGKLVRGICVYGVGDLPWLVRRPELFANKFHLTYNYLSYDCLEQWHRQRTKMAVRANFNADLYRRLPTVQFGRKDGMYQR